MAKWIEAEIDDTRARFLLQEELVPRTATALWEALPLTLPLQRSALSGESCAASFSAPGLAALPARLEVGVASIYPGWMVLRTTPAATDGELLISFGQAEYRTATGRQHVTPVAEVEGDSQELLTTLRRVYDGGEHTIVLRQAGQQ
jgi:hypothetical protein